MPVTVRQELVSGTIERFLVSAHGPVNGILGTMLFPLIKRDLQRSPDADAGRPDVCPSIPEYRLV
jgi:hypothetical protein